MDKQGQHGYAMAALLVALPVMAILMTAAMPTWRQMVRREQEAELIFRGQQYAHAIGLFQRRAGPGVLPPNLDVLVEQNLSHATFATAFYGVINTQTLELQYGRAGHPSPVLLRAGANVLEPLDADGGLLGIFPG